MPKKSSTSNFATFIYDIISNIDWRRYVLFAILFFTSSIFSYCIMNFLSYSYPEYFCGPVGMGFPLAYQTMGESPCTTPGAISIIKDRPSEFRRSMYFIFDIVFWYVIAKVTVMSFDGVKLRRKRRKK
jgi:hypothetical protein